jgi:hypothetical protein
VGRLTGKAMDMAPQSVQRASCTHSQSLTAECSDPSSAATEGLQWSEGRPSSPARGRWVADHGRRMRRPPVIIGCGEINSPGGSIRYSDPDPDS